MLLSCALVVEINTELRVRSGVTSLSARKRETREQQAMPNSLWLGAVIPRVDAGIIRGLVDGAPVGAVDATPIGGGGAVRERAGDLDPSVLKGGNLPDE